MHLQFIYIETLRTSPHSATTHHSVCQMSIFVMRLSRVGVRCNGFTCLKTRKVTIGIGNNSWIVETFFVCYIKMTFFLSRVCTFKTITCDKNLIQCKNIILWIISLISSLVNIYLYFYYTNIFLFLKSYMKFAIEAG